MMAFVDRKDADPRQFSAAGAAGWAQRTFIRQSALLLFGRVD